MSSSCRASTSRRSSTFRPMMWGRSMQRVQRVAAAVERGLGADGSFVAMNNRVSQSVPHLHVHVVPRHRGDGLRGFFWPRRKYQPGEAEEVAEKLRTRCDGVGRRMRRRVSKHRLSSEASRSRRKRSGRRRRDHRPNSARHASRPSMQMSSRRRASHVDRGRRRCTSRSPRPCRTPMCSPFGS